jgi:hypothetical protein
MFEMPAKPNISNSIVLFLTLFLLLIVLDTITGLQDYRIIGFQDYRISGLQDYKIIGLQDYRITGLQDYRIIEL